MILYIEDPKDATRKLLELIKEFNKVAGYKINTQKSVAFLYTNDKRPEREIKETIPFTIAICESWTTKKAECRIDAFELWCWRRIIRVPWTARRSNQSILKISPGCSFDGLMLNLKLQTLATSCEEFGKDSDAGKN